MIFGEIESFFSLWGRVIKLFKAGSEEEQPEQEIISKRFIQLFENHGVHRNQIPRFFGHDLSLSDVHDDSVLLSKLNEQILDDACDLFAVRREWLDGAEAQIYPILHFYKQPEKFLEFIQGTLSSNPESFLQGVLIAPKEKSRNANALLVLKEQISLVGDNPVYRYHLCDQWAYGYWKSRTYLAACIAMVSKHAVSIYGLHAPGREIEKLASGHVLIDWEADGVTEIGHHRWEPDELVIQPEKFLQGIDPEKDNFGKKAALRLWLSLEEKGFMDAGYQSPRKEFEVELVKYT